MTRRISASSARRSSIGDAVDRVGELVGRNDEAALPKVHAVEPQRELEQDVVALVADALNDLANGVGYVRVDLEAPGLEPLPPIPEVEELEHLVLLDGLVMLVGGGDRARAPVAGEQDPSARRDERPGGDQQAQGQQERAFTVHGAARVPETPRGGNRRFGRSL